MKFEEMNLSENVKKALGDIGYIEATPIQERAIPILLEGKDMIGQSQTGTGKTASFGLPIIEKVDTQNKNTQVIVLCPTRELANQITDEIRKYTKYMQDLKILAVYGGQGIDKQIMPLKRGVQIVIGTPGRVMDHLRRKTLKLDDVKMVVLDEADEMLSMGFEEDIETVLSQVPEERQTILFSATMNPKIKKVASKYLKTPENINIKSKELVVDSIEQICLDMKRDMKDETLTRLIDINKPKKAIVFCNTKRKVDDLIEKLKEKQYRVEGIHGDIKQIQRERIMKRLKNAEIQILVATDVVARGIDIEDLDLVINYDIPQEEEYYVHRIGRTGRNGHIGKSFTFVVGKERSKMFSIQKYANTKMKQGKIPTIEEVNNVKNVEIIDKVQKVIDENKYKNEELFNKLLEQNDDIKQVALALFSMVTDNKTSNVKKFENINREVIRTSNGATKLFFNIGKKDKVGAGDIVGSVTANAGISGDNIGKVNVLDKFSFVEVPSDFAQNIILKMSGKQIKGKDVNIEIANR